ncbi:hypothetical protein MPSEU_001059500 [Mayamaea pseudoterrestris]|nr:hypothetical protein MPSEU_001059500 [Mayamaea pseudoterrestris]
MSKSFITELRAADVLLGRGSGPNDHEGNIRFRLLVQERKDEYLATNHRVTKGRIAQEIVDQVFARNGRFLRKLDGQDALEYGVPEGIDAWLAVDEETIMEKAKQALRQNTQKNKGGQVSPVPSNNTNVQIDNLKSGRTIDMEPLPFGVPASPTLPMQAPSAVYRMAQSQPQMAYNAEPPFSQFNPIRRVSDNNTTDHVPIDRQSWFGEKAQQYQQRVSNGTSEQHFVNHQQPTHIVASQEEDPDSMLAYLRPPTVISAYSECNNGGSCLPEAAPQQDLAAAPNYNNCFNNNAAPTAFVDRRGSMTMSDLAHAHVNRRRYSNMNMSGDTNMSDIMDSISKMSVHTSEADQQLQTRRRQQQLMHTSSDTMGTIDDYGANTSMADMSFATVDTSTFSSTAFKPPESISSQSGSSNEKQPQQTSPTTIPTNVYKKNPVLDRNAYSAMSGNLGALPTPPNLIRPEGGVRRRGRRTSIDMNANEHHDILESAEYIYHQPSQGIDNAADDGQSTIDMPKPAGLVDAPSRDLDLTDLGASSLSFKAPYASNVDIDMSSALFENLHDSEFK